MKVYVKVKLPFCLYLKDAPYRLAVPELDTPDEALVILSKFRRAKENIDYATFWRAELVERGELWNDPQGTFRRTEAIVVLPAAIIQAPIDLNSRAFHDEFPRIMDTVVSILNRLIVAYRYATEDTYIPVVEAQDIYNTFTIGNCAFEEDGAVRYEGREVGFDNRLTNTRPDYDEATHKEIRKWLTSNELIPLHDDFMMNAHFQLQNRNWRAAVIEAQTAFEVFTSDRVRVHYQNSGYDDVRVGNILKCGLRNLVTDHLSKAVGKEFKQGQAEYDRWDEDTYSMRNKVVHEGYAPSEQEAISAVLGVENAFTYLVGRPEKRFWPKTMPPTTVNEFIFQDAQE